MPLLGGAADKIGNRYEGRWTVDQMVTVLAEKATVICLEPTGFHGDGVEFYIELNGIRQYHQVKRQRTRSGKWSLSDLNSERVLERIKAKLAGSNSQFHFVSTHAANQLQDLSERARDATTFGEFEKEFLKSSQQSADFNSLCEYWNGSSRNDAYDLLRLVFIRTIDEETLKDKVVSRLESVLDGDPETAADILAQYALDKIHQDLTALDIWHHLESRGVRRNQWSKDHTVTAAVNNATERYCSELLDESVGDRPIPRHEAGTIVQELFAKDGKRVVMATGEAGVGKSGVNVQVLEELRARGWPVLALRVDRIEGQAMSARQIGKLLDLPGSPGSVLAQIADGRECLLLVDQLDAISLASGRRTELFGSIRDVISQALTYPNLRVLLACRKFDLNNDHRIRGLANNNDASLTIVIERLPHDHVTSAITRLGFDASRLSRLQIELFSVPLHLRLLTETAKDDSLNALNITSVSELFDTYCTYKQRAIRARAGGPTIQWELVLNVMCDYMSEHQSLAVPTGKLGHLAVDTDLMTSEHVIVKDRLSYAFFHEGFFDYVFAKRFVNNGDTLLQFLLSGEQHLFRRNQVRQILTYKRRTDLPGYVSDVKAVLESDSVRFHIKQVVFALLRDLTDPTAQEWAVLNCLVSRRKHDNSVPSWAITLSARLALRAARAALPGALTPRWYLAGRLAHDKTSLQGWNALARSPAWFALLDSLGTIEKWLKDEDESVVNRATNILYLIEAHVPDRVAELISPFVGRSADWNDRILYLLRGANLGTSRALVDLLIRVIGVGGLDDGTIASGNGKELWLELYSLATSHPLWTAEIVGKYLDHRLEASYHSGEQNPFAWKTGTISDSQFDDHVLIESAKGAPSAFIEHILPFMLRVMTGTTGPTDLPPRRDGVWGLRLLDSAHSVETAILLAMETAMREVAATAPGQFAEIAALLRESEMETVQFLLIRAYTANGKRFADDAAGYLTDNPGRLATGYIDNSHWATRELLEVITPHCDEDQLRNLEDRILNYYPESEARTTGTRHVGWGQFTLLTGCDPTRLSTSARNRLAELGRKYEEDAITHPRAFKMQEVASPVPEFAIPKMTDEQWMRAIAKYTADDTSVTPKGVIRGGAPQLSDALERRTKDDPHRFGKLALKLPDDSNTYYF